MNTRVNRFKYNDNRYYDTRNPSHNQTGSRFGCICYYGPLIFRTLILFLFIVPLISLSTFESCYAMNRPDYFWPVSHKSAPSEGFSPKNMSRKFKWIFLLGLVTHLVQLAVTHFKNAREEERRSWGRQR